MCAGLLDNHLFNLNFFFLSHCLTGQRIVLADVHIPLLASPILQQSVDVGWPDWREVSTGLSPAKCRRLRSPANSSPGNMVINPLEPEFCQELLSGPGGRASTNPSQGHILYQGMSYGPRGPHAVSKALGRRRH
jgi:hypothetical protein